MENGRESNYSTLLGTSNVKSPWRSGTTQKMKTSCVCKEGVTSRRKRLEIWQFLGMRVKVKGTWLGVEKVHDFFPDHATFLLVPFSLVRQPRVNYSLSQEQTNFDVRMLWGTGVALFFQTSIIYKLSPIIIIIWFNFKKK